jgi:hypothetical protein
MPAISCPIQGVASACKEPRCRLYNIGNWRAGEERGYARRRSNAILRVKAKMTSPW